MNKERVKKGLISAAPFIAGAGIQIPYIFDDGGWFNLAMLLTNAGVAYINYKNGVVKFDREAFVKSPICQEYLELYKDFVKDIATAYEELGINPGLEAAVAFRYCLENGMFSKDKTNSYALFENDNDKFIAFLGGRVATGKQCCRHSASLFSDINSNMKKGLSPKISVFLSDTYSKKIKLKPNHLVSGLVHKNKKMLFDSTSSFNNVFADGLGFIQDKKVRGRVVAENVTGTKFNFVNDAYDNKLLATDTYELFMDLESIKDSSEIFDDYMEAIFSIVGHAKDFSDLHEEEKPKILQLANLSTIVSSHGKEIVKEK
ncbi:MAG: hypothetical protein J6C28_06485 [Bacilli bacterium]|nr:hypothetical protein [Bacilli bacterium]